MFAIYKREMRSYIFSPLPYVLLGLFISVLAIMFSAFMNGKNTEFGEYLVTGILEFALTILAFLIPILTMRVLAEERKNSSDVILMSAPISITKVIIAKYLSLLTILFAIMLTTSIYPIIMLIYGKFYFAQTLGGYLGFYLVAACFVSIGLFTSSLTKNQIVAAIISLIINLSFLFMEMFNQLGEGFAKVFNWISVFIRYSDFQKGLLNIPSILYFLSFIAIFLFLTIRVVEKRRWS